MSHAKCVCDRMIMFRDKIILTKDSNTAVKYGYHGGELNCFYSRVYASY